MMMMMMMMMKLLGERSFQASALAEDSAIASNGSKFKFKLDKSNCQLANIGES
jgi:hypothetical protein